MKMLRSLRHSLTEMFEVVEGKLPEFNWEKDEVVVVENFPRQKYGRVLRETNNIDVKLLFKEY